MNNKPSRTEIIVTYILFITLAILSILAPIVTNTKPKAEEIEPEFTKVVEVTPIPKVETKVLPAMTFEKPEVIEPITEPVIEEPIEVKVVEPEVDPVLYFDVPLEEALQDHIFALCEEYEIDPAIVMAMIRKESTFDSGAIGDNGKSFGLMQIQKRFHLERMEKLGCTDLLDPYQNVMVGIDCLAELISLDRGLEWALMCYNGGYSYANEKAANGELSYYAQYVLDTSKQLERGVSNE